MLNWFSFVSTGFGWVKLETETKQKTKPKVMQDSSLWLLEDCKREASLF